eukprot:3213046-Pyramimonas_sp.AAC.2
MRGCAPSSIEGPRPPSGTLGPRATGAETPRLKGRRRGRLQARLIKERLPLEPCHWNALRASARLSIDFATMPAGEQPATHPLAAQAEPRKTPRRRPRRHVLIPNGNAIGGNVEPLDEPALQRHLDGALWDRVLLAHAQTLSASPRPATTRQSARCLLALCWGVDAFALPLTLRGVSGAPRAPRSDPRAPFHELSEHFLLNGFRRGMCVERIKKPFPPSSSPFGCSPLASAAPAGPAAGGGGAEALGPCRASGGTRRGRKP